MVSSKFTLRGLAYQPPAVCYPPNPPGNVLIATECWTDPVPRILYAHCHIVGEHNNPMSSPQPFNDRVAIQLIAGGDGDDWVWLGEGDIPPFAPRTADIGCYDIGGSPPMHQKDCGCNLKRTWPDSSTYELTASGLVGETPGQPNGWPNYPLGGVLVTTTGFVTVTSASLNFTPSSVSPT